MKHSILTILVVCLIGSVSLAGFYPGTTYPIEGPIPVAGQFTISNHDLATWDILQAGLSPLGATDTDPAAPGIGWDVPGINNTEFNFAGFTFPPGSTGSTWVEGQVGWSANESTLPEDYVDLSGYDSFILSFHNEVFGTHVTEGATHHAVKSALFIETAGGTYQSDFIWSLPCDNLILDLDLTGAQQLDTVISMGMVLGSYLYDETNWGIENQTGFKVCIDTVPLPGAVLLGILGLGVAGWKLRKYA